MPFGESVTSQDGEAQARVAVRVHYPQALAASLRTDGGIIGMPFLTRRRDLVARQEAWLIYYGDIQVGSIGLRTGAGGSTIGLGPAASIQPRIMACTPNGTAKSFDRCQTDEWGFDVEPALVIEYACKPASVSPITEISARRYVHQHDRRPSAQFGRAAQLPCTTTRRAQGAPASD
jgi:hypothetical protein